MSSADYDYICISLTLLGIPGLTLSISLDYSDETIAPFSFSGSMNGRLFEGWLEHVFVPALKNPSKSVLIIDNASHRRKNAIYDIADEYEFRAIFLPTYSPDLNSIEKF